MLSAAKHPLFLVENKSRSSGVWSRMPRPEWDSEDSTGVLKSDLAPAREDMVGAFFISLLG